MAGFTYSFATLSKDGAVKKHTVKITPEDLAGLSAQRLNGSTAQRSSTISKEANSEAPLLATDKEVVEKKSIHKRKNEATSWFPAEVERS